MYLGSADWMARNLDRRVEAVVPVLDPQLCVQLEWLLELYLNDDVAAWRMQADGSYRQASPIDAAEVHPPAQQELMELWGLTAPALTSAEKSGWSATTTTTP